jgi:hypothetical protein
MNIAVNFYENLKKIAIFTGFVIMVLIIACFRFLFDLSVFMLSKLYIFLFNSKHFSYDN